MRRAAITGLGSWEFRLSDNRLILSEGAEKILGLQNGAPLSELQEITLPEYNSVREQALQRLIENGIPYDIELKFARRTDGAIIDVRSMGEYDPETNSVFGVLLDITEQTATEMELQRSRARYVYALWAFVLAQLIVIVALLINVWQRKSPAGNTPKPRAQ